MLETGAVKTDNKFTETVSFIRVRVSHSVKFTVLMILMNLVSRQIYYIVEIIIYYIYILNNIPGI